MAASPRQRDYQQPLELILARNLISSIGVPAFLTDGEGDVVFYNEGAGEILGTRFEETGRLSREEWNQIGPVGPDGEPVASTSAPLRTALHENRPAHQRFRLRSDGGALLMVETTAVPLSGAEGFAGAVVFFWPADGDG